MIHIYTTVGADISGNGGLGSQVIIKLPSSEELGNRILNVLEVNEDRIIDRPSIPLDIACRLVRSDDNTIIQANESKSCNQLFFHVRPGGYMVQIAPVSYPKSADQCWWFHKINVRSTVEKFKFEVDFHKMVLTCVAPESLDSSATRYLCVEGEPRKENPFNVSEKFAGNVALFAMRPGKYLLRLKEGGPGVSASDGAVAWAALNLTSDQIASGHVSVNLKLGDGASAPAQTQDVKSRTPAVAKKHRGELTP